LPEGGGAWVPVDENDIENVTVWWEHVANIKKGNRKYNDGSVAVEI
jgi:hypothetical protein